MAATETSPAPERTIAARPYFFAALPKASLVYRNLCIAARDFESLTESPDNTPRAVFTHFLEQADPIAFKYSTSGVRPVFEHEVAEELAPVRDRFALAITDMFRLSRLLVKHVKVLSSQSLGVQPTKLSILEFMASALDILKVCPNLLHLILGKELSDVMLRQYATTLVRLITSDHTTSDFSHRASPLSGTRPTTIFEIVCTQLPATDALDHEFFAKKRAILRSQDIQSVLARYLFPTAATAEYELINSYKAYIKTRNKNKLDLSGYPSGYQRLERAQKSLEDHAKELAALRPRLPPALIILLQSVRILHQQRQSFVLKEVQTMVDGRIRRLKAMSGTYQP
jgi:hypothetical protein